MNLYPINQTSLFGHTYCFNELINLNKQSKLPNKIILSGEKGIGKCTIAYHLINYILSSSEEFSYDLKNYKINVENRSFKLTQNKSNPNFTLIDVATDKKNIDINQIRNLIINLNKSSFNSRPRFVLIDNIEFLNVNSINALLKVLEEPNDNIHFILINNNKKILSTLKSRCLNFKISLTYNQSIEIINDIMGNDIHNLINEDLINNYITPGQLLRLINFAKVNDVDLKKNTLEEIIALIIKGKYYKKESIIINLIYSLIEMFFRKNISTRDIKLFDAYNYFLKKIDSAKKFNLDEETLFMEFEDRFLNG